MPAEPQDNQQTLWTRVLEAVAEKVSPHAFDTWFQPVVFTAFSDDAVRLAVPNDTFRQGLLDNYGTLLGDILAAIIPFPCRLEISPRNEACVAAGLSMLPVVRISEIEPDAENQPWLIDRLWSAHAVGFVSGPPKSFKTWTCLEMAVSVASGTPCFGSFPVHRSGPVLLFAAEDPMPALRSRLESLAQNHGLTLDRVDIRVIRADSLHLDRPGDREKLAATVKHHRPALLILDPLVRLHSLDENQAGPMAELLGHIRALQRSSGTSIAIAHHSRKNGARSAGQSLRGSSDLYAFVDSLVSLQHRNGRVTLSAEHRSAPGLPPLPLELVAATQKDRAPSLRIATGRENDPAEQADLTDRVIGFLSESQSPCTADSIRAALQVRKQRVLEALRALLTKNQIQHEGKHYIMANNNERI
jgi:AAA domain/DnaA N-terminal domain